MKRRAKVTTAFNLFSKLKDWFVLVSTKQKRRTTNFRSPLKLNIFLISIMPHLQTFPPTQNTKQQPTCATCPFFCDFHDRERGLCEVFDTVFKKQNLRTFDCDRSIESLLKQPKTCAVKVELITSEVEDDGSGHAVPVDSQTVEINVAQPLKALVEAEIANNNNLQGWQVAIFWQPDPDGRFEI